MFGDEDILTLEWDKSEDSRYGGSLCARGNGVKELIATGQRLNYPFVLGDRTNLEAAVREAAGQLKEIIDDSGGDSISMLLSDNLTVEETALALEFADRVLGTRYIDIMSPDDVAVFRAYLDYDLSRVGTSESRPDGDKITSLIVGDPIADHPCVAKDILPDKNASRSGEVMAISAYNNHSSWFADRHLRCRAGGEGAVLAGLLKALQAESGVKLPERLKKLTGDAGWDEIEKMGAVARDDIEQAAGALLESVKVNTYLSNYFGRFGDPAITSVLAEAVTRACPGESKYIPQFVQQNSWGVYSVLSAGGRGNTMGRIVSGQCQALVMLGLDIFSAYPAAPVEKALREKKFTLTTQMFWNKTAARSNVVIPAASLVEKKGTSSHGFGEDLVREEVISPPGGAVTDMEFLMALAGEMGQEISPPQPQRKLNRSNNWDSLEGLWKGYRTRMEKLETAGTVLLPLSDPVHAGDGSVSRYLGWSINSTPRPLLMISMDIAGKLNLENRDRVKIKSEGGEVVLEVRKTGKLEGNRVAGTIHFPEVRRLFPWEVDEGSGQLILSPVAVELEKEE